jgi:hypothetical protein
MLRQAKEARTVGMKAVRIPKLAAGGAAIAGAAAASQVGQHGFQRQRDEMGQ